MRDPKTSFQGYLGQVYQIHLAAMFVLTLLQVRCRRFLWFISIHFRFSCSKMPVGKRSLGAGFYPNAKVPAKKAVPLLREGFAIPIASAPSLAIESRPALPISEADRRFEGEPRPYQRGDSKKAMAAAKNPSQCREVLQQDVFSGTSKGPIQSRLKLWEQLAIQCGHQGDPFCLDPALIFSVMGALKIGGYRSAINYLETAKGHHIAMGHLWGAQLEQARRAAIRSCKRGLGSSKQAEGLPLEKLSEVTEELPLVDGGPRWPGRSTLLASWWLLREIEASRARRCHITVDHTVKKVTWRLPSSKTDQAALGADRSHTCSCEFNLPSTCPYHAMVRHLEALRDAPDTPVFPQSSGYAATKQGWADTFQEIALLLNIPITKQNGVRCFTGHTARVTGARYMAANSIELWRIQLFGRWGSAVFMHYIGSAPLQQLDALAQESSAKQSVEKAKSELETLLRKVDALRPKLTIPDPAMLEDCEASLPLVEQSKPSGEYVQNNNLRGKTHKVLDWAGTGHPRTWRTVCGWRFGLNHTEFTFIHEEALRALPTHKKCSKCFAEIRRVESKDSASCTSSASSLEEEESLD